MLLDVAQLKDPRMLLGCCWDVAGMLLGVGGMLLGCCWDVAGMLLDVAGYC
jgi:hypothetical protein